MTTTDRKTRDFVVIDAVSADCSVASRLTAAVNFSEVVFGTRPGVQALGCRREAGYTKASPFMVGHKGAQMFKQIGPQAQETSND